jgi:pilus assembly protein CpaB
MTVRVNDVVGVAGFALPGNFVDVLVNTQGEPLRNATMQGQAISKIVLERIRVLAIAQEATRDDTQPKVVNAVTLELTPGRRKNWTWRAAWARCRWCCATRWKTNPSTRMAPPSRPCSTSRLRPACPCPAARPALPRVAQAGRSPR